jgi:hypothetical protein
VTWSGCSGEGSGEKSDTFTIFALAGSGGSIHPEGPVAVAMGADQVFTFEPDPDYEVEDILVDDISQGVASTYTFENVQSDHVISAWFRSGLVDIQGSFRNLVSDVVFDRAEVSLVHKRDVDAFEDGCITSLEANLSRSTGCQLYVYAGGMFLPQVGMRIGTVEFSADSYCPGFPDSSEGTYTGRPDIAGVKLGVRSVPGDNVGVSEVSMELTILLEGSLHRDSDGEELRVNQTEIVLSGEFQSIGDTELSCPFEGECSPGISRPCGDLPNLGECEQAEVTCGEDGKWGECTGGVWPTQELCDDDLDNDCDGDTDEQDSDCDED